MAQSKRGRPKGAGNRVTNEAKRAILMAFDQLGGVKRLVDWVNKDTANETLYWTKIFPKLLPRPTADVAPAIEAPVPIRGALTWRTPDWAKAALSEVAQPRSRRSQLRAGVAETAAAVAEATGPPDGPPPPGWVAEVGR